jgi:hypothetical protein
MLEWLQAILFSIPSFFINPFTYLLLLLIAIQWKRQIDMERRLFSIRLHTVTEGLLQSVMYGLLAGIGISLLIVGLGVVFSLEAILYLWFIAFILMLFNVRYLCFAYAGAILGLAVLVVNFFPMGVELDGLAPLVPLWTSLESISLPSLFAMVALLHLAEALLVHFTGWQKATPIFIQSKRGKIVGGYHIQHFWWVPLLVVTESTTALPPLYPQWPLFFQQEGLFTLLLFPAVLAFSDQAISSTPQQKARMTSRGLMIYSLILLGLSFGAIYYPQLLIACVLFSCLAHEALIIFNRWREERRSPIYTHPANGIKILAVVPHSPASKMGLKSGEVILKANGFEVNKRSELYRAIKENKAFCKLEVLNVEGHVKFPKTSLYEKDHHQLGVILAPDDQIPYYLEQRPLNLIQLIRKRWVKKNQRQSADM